MKNVTSVDELTNMLELKMDDQSVTFGKNTIESILQKNRKSLETWLYVNIHVGNPWLYENMLINCIPNLNEQIELNLGDNYNMTVKVPTIGTPAGEFAMLTGLRVKTDIVDQKILVPCIRPNLTPGFYMFTNLLNRTADAIDSRFYVASDTPEYAIAVWSKSVKKLYKENINFSAKVLSNDKLYPRSDAIVFYSGQDKNKVEDVLYSVISEVNSEIKVPNSPLCCQIFRNLTTAQQPIDQEGSRQSFGEHRCKAIANAIFDYFETGMDFKFLLNQRFNQFNIDVNDISKGTN